MPPLGAAFFWRGGAVRHEESAWEIIMVDRTTIRAVLVAIAIVTLTVIGIIAGQHAGLLPMV